MIHKIFVVEIGPKVKGKHKNVHKIVDMPAEWEPPTEPEAEESTINLKQAAKAIKHLEDEGKISKEE